MSQNTTQLPSWTSSGAGITRDYDHHSEPMRIFVSLFSGLALYNALELIIMIFLTFRRRRGLYFWSLLVSSIAVIPYSLGFLLKFLDVTDNGEVKWVPIVLLTLGWWPMIIGQALVLWSRLHLIIFGAKGTRVITATKYMIIFTSIFLLLPTTVLTFGSNSNLHQQNFSFGYNIMEKIQMFGFCAQETTLSSIYIVETVKILRTSLQPDTRTTMRQLIAINVVIITMDLGLLGLECASLYILETLLKGVIYSIKLKLEFAILGKLVKFVGGSSRPSVDLRKSSSIGFISTQTDRQMSKDDRNINIQDFVDLERITTDVTQPSRSRQSSSIPSHRKGSRVPGMNWEYDMARFEHIEDVATLQDAGSTHSSTAPLRGIEEV